MGLDAARKINLQAPNIKFVFLTMRDDPNLAADLTPKLRSEDWVATKARAMKEIAGLLDLSEKTLEFHKNHVMKAFNLGNNAAPFICLEAWIDLAHFLIGLRE
jgi:DNA-binding NarL/FixJ family response regulator